MNTFYRLCIWLFFCTHWNASDVFPLHLVVVVIGDDFKCSFGINKHLKTRPTDEESKCRRAGKTSSNSQAGKLSHRLIRAGFIVNVI